MSEDADEKLMAEIVAEEGEEEKAQPHGASGSESGSGGSDSEDESDSAENKPKSAVDMQAALEAAKEAAGLIKKDDGPDKEGELVAEDMDEVEMEARAAAAKLALKKKAQAEARARMFTEQMFDASKLGHIDQLREALNGGADPNAVGGVPATTKAGIGFAALHLAAAGAEEEKQVSCVDLLLEAGADVNAVTASGWTALHFAAFWGRTTVAQRLLEWYADVTMLDSIGRSAHAKACYRKHTEIAKLLETWGGGAPEEDARKMRSYDEFGGWAEAEVTVKK